MKQLKTILGLVYPILIILLLLSNCRGCKHNDESQRSIKEPVDTIYMFWAISVGIMTGAGIYLVAASASLGIGLFYFISYMMGFKVSSQYLLIVRYDVKDDKEIIDLITKIGKTKLKSKNVTKNVVEVSYEVAIKQDANEVLKEFEGNEKVINASIISYQNDFGI